MIRSRRVFPHLQAGKVARAIGAKQEGASRTCVEMGDSYYAVLCRDDLVFLAASSQQFSQRTAVAFLDALADDFLAYLSEQFGRDWLLALARQSRGYPCASFDQRLRQRRKEYVSAASGVVGSSGVRSRAGVAAASGGPSGGGLAGQVQSDLGDIRRVMTENIHDLLDRGAKLDDVRDSTSELVTKSKRMRWSAKKLRWMDQVRRWAPVAIGVLVILLVIWWRFFW